MRFIKAIGIVGLCYIGWVIAIDLVAVLLVTILPEPGDRRLNGSAGFGSLALYYAVWLVAGCLAGAFFTIQSLERTKSNALLQKKPLLIFITALLFSAGLILFFYTLGEMPDPRLTYSSSYYVPGNRNMTYTFFTSFLLVCLLLRNAEKK